MSAGRPKNPPTWATAETNYAALGKAWDSTPVRVVPVADFLTPGVTEPAQYMNYRLGTLSDSASALTTWTGQIPAKNWLPVVNPGFAAASPNALVWDAAYSQWLAVAAGGSDSLWQSTDYGQSWSSISISGGTSLSCYAIAADLAHNYVIANDNSTTLYAYFGGFASHAALTGTARWPDVTYDVNTATWGLVYNDTAGSKARVYRSTDGSTWTQDPSANLPGVFTTSLINTVRIRMGAGNGQFMIAMVTGGGPYYVAVSAAGTQTWTYSTITTTITPDTNVGVCTPRWDAVNKVWVLCFFDTTGYKSEIWTAPDGATWTKKSTLSTSAIAITSLAVLGELYLGAAKDNTFTSGTGVYSVDGGVTWYRSGVKLFTNSPTTAVAAAGGGGFVVIEHDGVGNNARSSIRLDLDDVAIT